MRVGLVSIVSSMVLLMVSSATLSMAQSAPFCGDAQSVDWLDAFAPLTEQLGDVMGDPVECAHQTSDGGDTVQATSTGLAILRSPSGLATFSDGTTHWALTGGRLRQGLARRHRRSRPRPFGLGDDARVGGAGRNGIF